MTLDIFPSMTSKNACFFFMGERVGHKIKYGHQNATEHY